MFFRKLSALNYGNWPHQLRTLQDVVSGTFSATRKNLLITNGINIGVREHGVPYQVMESTIEEPRSYVPPIEAAG